MVISTLCVSLIACGSDGGTQDPVTSATNKAPVALDQAIVTPDNTSIDIVLSGTDADNDVLTYAIAVDPQEGRLSGVAPNLTYTPNVNFVGDDSFSFTVNDGALTSEAATIAIAVEFVADSTPDAFAFVNRPEVPADSIVVSNPITISGINMPAKVVIANGEYSIDDAAFTALEGVITNQQSIRVRLNASSVLSAMVEALITIGGVSGVFKVTTSGDTLEPTASIIFPTAQTLTTEKRIIVRGSATDNGTIASVTVNNVTASSNNKFLNWRAVVPLEPGMNQISVLVTDLAGNSNNEVPIVTVESRPLFLDKTRIAYNNASAKLIFFDATLEGLYAFDASSQAYQVISDESKPEGGSDFFKNIINFDIDASTNSIYMIDELGSLDRLMQVDLATGLRTIVTEDSEPFAAHTLREPRHIEIDSAANVAYVLDGTPRGFGRRAVIKFDLTTGLASVLPLISDVSSAGPKIYRPSNIALDAANKRLFLTEPGGIHALFVIDLMTGMRSLFMPFSPSVKYFRGIAIDSQNQRALIYDAESNRRIVAIDLVSKELSTLVENLTLSVNRSNPVDMVYDDSNDQERVFIAAAGVIHQIDLKTGEESIFSSNTIPDESNPLNFARGLAIDSAKNRLLVTTSKTAQIMAIDLASGERSIVSDNLTMPNDVNPLDTPGGIAIRGDQAYVVDSGNLSIVSIDLADAANGARSILSDNNVIDENNTFNQLKALAVDTANARTLVVDSGRQALISVDNSSGERTVISDNRKPDSNSPIVIPQDLIIQGGRGLVLEFSTSSILSIDLADGTRTVFSGPGQPDNENQFSRPQKMVLDTAYNRLLVLDANGVMAVSLVDGTRSVLSLNRDVPAGSPGSKWLTDITLDVENNQALVLDKTLQRILAIDLVSGERTRYAGGTPNASAVLYRPRSIAYSRAINKIVVGTDGGAFQGDPVLRKIDVATGVRAAMPAATTGTVKDLVFAANDKLYMLGSDRLSELNTTTGAETVISDDDMFDDELQFISPQAVAFDLANNLAYVADRFKRSIFSIDLSNGLSNGQRQIIASNAYPDGSVSLFSSRISSLVFDPDNKRLLVLDESVGIIAVDINSGVQTAFSTADVPDNLNRLNTPRAMILEEKGKRLLVVDRVGIRVVNLTTGERTQLTENVDVANFLTTPDVKGISLISPDMALAIDDVNGVVLIDLLTGEQVILSR